MLTCLTVWKVNVYVSFLGFAFQMLPVTLGIHLTQTELKYRRSTFINVFMSCELRPVLFRQ